MMPATRSLLPLGLLLVAPLAAQNLALDKTGGGLGGTAGVRVQGTAGEIYAVLFDFVEQATTVPALGLTLQISDRWAGVAVSLPGFAGTLNAQGLGNGSVPVPNDPGLNGLVLSLQAVSGPSSGPYRASNLARLTLQAPGTWVAPLNQPSVPILGGTTAVAADGELLFVGGSGPVAQRYLSRTEQWELAGATFGVGILSQSTGLPDGRVLFTGGLDLTTGQPTTAAAIYDPIAQTTTTLAMGTARAGHGASLMGNGRVLITGGFATIDITNPLNLFNGIQASTEIFDPATGLFSPGPNMLEARALHTSTTLTNGNVLIAGGLTLLPIVNIPTVSATAYRFNPANNSFGLPAFFSGARFFHSAAPLSNGRVLLAGGLTLDLSVFLTTGQIQDIIVGTRQDCQLYASSLFGFGTFTAVNGMQEGRAGAAIAPLPNGGALIAGGFRLQLDLSTQTFVATATASADVFRQNPNTITPTGAMAAPRLFPITANLPDGTIMVLGGGPTGAEIYQQ